MYKELNKLNRKPTQDRVWSIRDLTGTLTHKSKNIKDSNAYPQWTCRFSGPYNRKVTQP